MIRAGRGTHTRDERCIQYFKTGNPMGRDHSGHIGDGVCKLRSACHLEHFNSARGNMQMFLRIRPNVNRKCCSRKKKIRKPRFCYKLKFWVPSRPKRNYVRLLFSLPDPTARYETILMHFGIQAVVLRKCV